MKNTRHGYKERGNDLYETPPEAVDALLGVEDIPDTVWEPACGPGSIVRRLRSQGYQVYATDLVDYNSPDQDVSGRDFMMELEAPIGVKAIVTNPPFRMAARFVCYALDLCPKVIMLLRLNFLEAGNAKTRDGMARLTALDGGHLARVHVFRQRLPMMHRDGWEGPKASSSMAFAWFVWDADHNGPATLNRINWK